jgi:hypothetical protein
MRISPLFHVILAALALCSPLSSRAQGAATQARSSVTFGIDSPEHNCSAALFKIQNRCFLVTARHCVRDSKQVTLSGAEDGDDRFFPTPATMGGHSPTVSKVERISSRYDIAQLEIPSLLQRLYCDSGVLKESEPRPWTSSIASSMALNIASLGVINGKTQIELTGNCRCEFRYPVLELLSPSDKDLLLILQDLDIHPGMSGGPAIDTDRDRLLGINTHYIPWQNTGGITPLITVWDFLNSNDRALQQPDDRPATQNATLPTGGNEHGRPGGNEHGNPGGNEHGNPAAQNLSSVGSIERLREPNEGVAFPRDSSKRILAVRSHGGFHQIDGFDDLKKYFLPHKDELRPNEIVLRPDSEDGYPELSIRQGILKRLEGSFSSLPQDLLTPRENERDLIYVKTDSTSQNWQLLLTGTPYNRIKIDAQAQSIELTIPQHFLRPPGTFGLQQLVQQRAWPPMDRKLRFQARFLNEDAKRLELFAMENGIEHRLVCENQHYLKLICSNDRWTFSVSTESDDKSTLKYRFGSVQITNQETLLENQFGRLKNEQR